jgi:hypothetical protein
LCNLATTTTGYTMITLAFMAVAMWFSGWYIDGVW